MNQKQPTNAAENEPVVVIEGLTKKYGEFTALDFFKIDDADGNVPGQEAIDSLRASPAWVKSAKMVLPFVSLFENAGNGTFRDVTVRCGVTMGRWAWASNFVDLNNDGWQDLLVANGMLTRAGDTGDL